MSFAEFKGALPRGIQFTWAKAELLAALGKPTKDDGGDLEWRDPKTKVIVHVGFASQWDKIPEGEIASVWLSR